MPITFNFDDGTLTNTQAGASPSVSTTDDGVVFTMSASASNGGDETIQYDALFDTLQLSSNGGTSGAFTLTFTDLAGNNGIGTGNVTVGLGSVLGTWNVTFLRATGPNVVVSGLTSTTNAAVTNTGAAFTGIRFTSTVSGTPGISITSLTIDALVCYLEGTGISTPRGRVAVEDLREGDQVLTADGRAVPVRWIGVQTVDAQTRHPTEINPIRISKNAFGHGLPERDLFVSPDHALGVGGYLVNAAALQNGTTIAQVRNAPFDGSFTYYHIETDAHELLLAEGLPAESYVDVIPRDQFDNGQERTDAPKIHAMDMPRISSQRLVPSEILQWLAPLRSA